MFVYRFIPAGKLTTGLGSIFVDTVFLFGSVFVDTVFVFGSVSVDTVFLSVAGDLDRPSR